MERGSIGRAIPLVTGVMTCRAVSRRAGIACDARDEKTKKAFSDTPDLDTLRERKRERFGPVKTPPDRPGPGPGGREGGGGDIGGLQLTHSPHPDHRPHET